MISCEISPVDMTSPDDEVITIRHTLYMGTHKSSLDREFTVFSHVKCMPDGEVP